MAVLGSAKRRSGSSRSAFSEVFDPNIPRSSDMTAVTPLPARPFDDSTDSLLRFAMRLDATMSGLVGLFIAAAADPISSLTGLSSIAEYGLGAFFVLYGLVVFGLASAPDLRRAGIGVVIANIVFTVAAVVVAAADAL